MDEEIPPLRGEGRRVGRVGGVYGELLSEFLGTFILIAFGDGVVAMTVAGLPGSGRTAEPTQFFAGAGDWLLIAFGWALAVTFAIYVAGGVSGAHINPAVTLAFAVRRRFPWAKVGPYIGAQMLGAFAGAALVYLVYHNAIDAFNEASKVTKSSGQALATFSIFATFPAGYYNGSHVGPLIDQIVGTAFLVMFVAAVIDARNQAVQANLAPFVIGLVVAAIGMSFGANAGYAINPARDFGPRFFAWIAGWGDVALPGSLSIKGLHFSGYFWVPIVGPLVGGTLGILIYDWFIGDVLHARLKPPPPGRVPEAATQAGAQPSETRTST
jgi:glycerol uptake facilitator protein